MSTRTRTTLADALRRRIADVTARKGTAPLELHLFDPEFYALCDELGYSGYRGHIDFDGVTVLRY